MKIVLIGSSGMLGSDLLKELAKTNYNVIGYNSQELDITKERDMDKIEAEKPDIIINCGAYTDVDQAEREREKCYAVNVTGVRNLVKVCRRNGLLLFHISTDYVFDGNEGKGYDENDEKSPVNYYGQTKSEAEDIVVGNLDRYYIIRTSWLFGKNRENFVERIINLCKTNREIRVISDRTGRPTYTVDLARRIVNLITNKGEYDYGIYHITNRGRCSRFEWAEEIAKLKKLNCRIKPCASEEFPGEAKRPKNSLLNNNKTGGLRTWREALKEYLNE